MKKVLSLTLVFVIVFSLLFTNSSLAFLSAAAASGNYYGILDDDVSDGGFEYGAWNKVSALTSATDGSTYTLDKTVKNRGTQAAHFSFSGGTEQSFGYTVTFSALSMIDSTENYCWTSYIKTSDDFSGNVYLKLCDPENLTATGLKNKYASDKSYLYDSTSAGTVTDWKRFDTGVKYYSASKLKSYLIGKSNVGIVLVVTGSAGSVWIDDIDFKKVSALTADEETEISDNKGAIGGSYHGLFQDATSDGGFENGAWTQFSEKTTAVLPSVFSYDTAVHNTDTHSAKFSFGGSKSEIFWINSVFSELSALNVTQNYCWTSYLKTSDDFDGKIILKIHHTGDNAGVGLNNKDSEAELCLYDAAVDGVCNAWTRFDTSDGYYQAARLAAWINEDAAVSGSSFGISIVVTACKGTLWMDDINLAQLSSVLGDDTTVEAGEYNGIFTDEGSNGGFEHGLWEKSSSNTEFAAPSSVSADTAVSHKGSRSLRMDFANNRTEKFGFTATLKDISKIKASADHFFKAFIKTTADFDGTVTLVVYDAADMNNALINNKYSRECMLYNSKANGAAGSFMLFNTKSSYYSGSEMQKWMQSIGDGGIKVLIYVSAKSGTVWIDDIDLINAEEEYAGICGEDPDTVYNVDQSDYKGLFDDQNSNGGFEYGVWTLYNPLTDAEKPTSYFTDANEKKTGKRSLEIDFGRERQNTVALKSVFSGLDEINTDENYCFTANIRTSADFNGSVYLKLIRHNDLWSSVSNTGYATESYLIRDSVQTGWRKFDTSEKYYTAAAIGDFVGQCRQDGCFDILLVTSGTAGSIWIDDINFLSLTQLKQEAEADVEGAVYDGMVVNGGFENGLWKTANPDEQTRTVSLISDETYNSSKNSLKAVMNGWSGISGALKMSSYSKSGTAAALNTAKQYCVAAKIRTEGSFNGAVYVQVKNGDESVWYNYATELNLVGSFDKAQEFSYSDWVTVYTPVFSVTGKDISINLFIDGAGTILVDDVNIISDPEGDNMIINGGFEANAWGGNMADGAAANIDTVVTDSTAKALRFTAAEGRSYVCSSTKTGTVDPAKMYKLSLSMKTVGTSVGGVYIMILQVGTQNGETKQKWVSSKNSEKLIVLSGTNEWQKRSIVVSGLEDWCSQLVIYINIEDKGTLYADNVYMDSNVTKEDLLSSQIKVNGAVYSGILYNGGFEGGLLPVVNYNKNIHDAEAVSDYTYNESLKALKATGKEFKGRDSALKFTTYSVSGTTQMLDTAAEYCLTAKIRTSGTFKGGIYVQVINGTESVWHNYSTELLLAGKVTEATEFQYDDWTAVYSPAFKITGENITVNLFIDGIGTVWMDDLDIVTDPEQGNMITNGGFESGTWGGAIADGATVASETRITSRSSKSMRMNGAPGRTYVVSSTKKNTVSSNGAYKLSVDLKSVAIGVGGAYISVLEIGHENGKDIVKWATFRNAEKLITVSGTTDWKTYSVILEKLESWCTELSVYINLEGVGTLYADNVWMDTGVTADDYLIKQDDVPGGKYSGILYNGGFESGLWSVSNAGNRLVETVSDDTYNGSLNALKVSMTERTGYTGALCLSTDTLSGAASKFNTNKKYCVAMWIKTSGDFNGSLYAELKQGGESVWVQYSTQLNIIGTWTEGGSGYSGWTQVYCPLFDVTGKDITVKIYLDGMGTILIDDVDIILDPEDENIVNNGGFEFGNWGWERADSEVLPSVVSDVTDHSAHASKMVGRTGGHMAITTGCKENFDRTKSYTLSLSLKTVDVEPDGAYLMILEYGKYDGKDKAKWLTSYSLEKLVTVGGTTDWKTYNVNCQKFEEWATGVKFYIMIDGGGTVYTDNVWMTEKKVNRNIPAGTVGADIPGGEVEPLSVVHLFTTGDDSDIYYTTDGSDPYSSSSKLLYNDFYGVVITEDMTVKAYASAEDKEDGPVCEFEYTCPSMIPNNGFENGLWNPKIQGTMLSDSAEKKSGSKSMKMVGNGADIYVSSGEITIDSSYDYDFDFWVKTQDMSMEDSAYVTVFMSGPGNENFDGESGVYCISQYDMCKIEQDQDWTHYSFELTDLNNAYSSVSFVCGVRNDFGTMWLDDFHMTARQAKNYSIVLSSGGDRTGNIYEENIMSQFVIEQEIKLKNQSKQVEAGKLSYTVLDEDGETIVNATESIAVQSGMTSAVTLNLSTVTAYGIFTVKCSVTNEKGFSYDIGSITLSRVRDAAKSVSSSEIAVSSHILTGQERNLTSIESHLDTLKKSGLSVLREEVLWQNIETVSGVYHIPEWWDTYIDAANERGMKVMLILNNICPLHCSGFPQTDAEIQAYANFAVAVAEHFKGRIFYYELFNEPNYMPYQKTTGDVYAAMLKGVYGQLKAVDSAIQVIAGAPSAVGKGDGVDLKFTEDILKAGGADYMDLYSFHPYIQPYSPEAADWCGQIDEAHELFVKYTQKDIHFWLTEMGWSTCRTDWGVTDAEQAAYWVRTLAYAETLSYVDKVFVYETYSGGNKYWIESCWGLLESATDAARPSFVGIASHNSLLNNFVYESTQDFADELHVLQYKNESTKKNIYMLWTEDKDYYADITLSEQSGKLYDFNGNALTLDWADDSSMFTADAGGQCSYLMLDDGVSIEKIVMREKVPQEETASAERKSSRTLLIVLLAAGLLLAAGSCTAFVLFSKKRKTA